MTVQREEEPSASENTASSMPEPQAVTDEVDDVFGPAMASSVDGPSRALARRREFSGWHHPVKQVVRTKQWYSLTKQLVDSWDERMRVLRYLTLPGPDLFDVRTLADACAPKSVQIEMLGFDSSAGQDDSFAEVSDAMRAQAEASLRQSGRVTNNSTILRDRLEDIAVPQSHARQRLAERAAFDVINIDACNHLGYLKEGRTQSLFDALRHLLIHQQRATRPWLLFITTRVAPELLGGPGAALKSAVSQNLALPEGTFAAELAALVNEEESSLHARLDALWSTQGEHFLRLFTVGLGKFLLQHFVTNPGQALPADVRLCSSYAYRVFGAHADMLALAFRVVPGPPVIHPPATTGPSKSWALEPERARKVAKRAGRLLDIDSALEQRVDWRREAISGSKALLRAANYDIAAWTEWVRQHKQRPMEIDVFPAET